MRPATTLFEDAIDVPAWLELDRHVPLAERTHRDRQIGKTLTQAATVQQVRMWWQRVERGTYDAPGKRLQRGRRWLNLALLAAGLIGGMSVALAAFRYDGTYPVNVVRLLGLLVAPQLLLLALSLLLLPGRLPGLRAVQDTLAAINPGAWAQSLLARAGRTETAAPFDWAESRSLAARRVAKWQMLFWSQLAAVGFNIAAIATAIALIAFTDLAFGWSTTLNVEAQTAARIVSAIAAPWDWFAPAAVPDAALVEQSRFFRLDGSGRFTADASQALTGWWSFTLFAMAIYGLVPRLGFCVVAAWRLRQATCALLLDNPRVTALLDRMSAPEIATSVEHAQQRGIAAAPASAKPRPAVNGTANAVIWNECIDADLAADAARSTLGLTLDVVSAAGSGTLEDDRAALRAVAKDARSVLVIAPAWEPPLLEFGDFLGELRAALGAGPSIVVLPIGERGTASTALERETWTRAVQRNADPQLYVEAGEL
jgi:hypothetical protein